VIDEKAAARRHDVPTLDSDPFIDAQDWEIAAVDIAVTDVPPDKGGSRPSVSRTWINRRRSFSISSRWRVANFTWQRDGKAEILRGLYGH
jgi:hypothetical protein